MKIIKYTLAVPTDGGTPVLFSVEMGWNPTNEAIAAREAYQGAYTREEEEEWEEV